MSILSPPKKFLIPRTKVFEDFFGQLVLAADSDSSLPVDLAALYWLGPSGSD